MPPARRTAAAPQQQLSAEERQYATNLAKMRAEIRQRVNHMISIIPADLPAAAEKTDGRITRMRWTQKGYALWIVHRGRYELKGWPWYFNIPFGNLSDVPGGQDISKIAL